MTTDELDEMMKELCRSKAEEFRLIGYEHVTEDDVWQCVAAKYAKSGPPSLHRLVNDILSLKATQLMNHLTMSAFKGTSF